VGPPSTGEPIKGELAAELGECDAIPVDVSAKEGRSVSGSWKVRWERWKRETEKERPCRTDE
jgi:hypothetical protein